MSGGVVSGPSIGQFDVPAMPPLAPELVAAHDRGHAEVASALSQVGDHLRTAFHHVQWRILQEAAASLHPPFVGQEPQIVPPRRRLVERSHQLRYEGCGRALRYVDSRVAMRRMGAVGRVVEEESPMVLHAFADGAEPHQRRSNPGSVRATPVSFAEGDIPYMPPPAEHCRRLLATAVDVANEAPAPPLTRATWLMQVFFAIHPFVDGNGRTGRLLCHAILSEHSPVGIDWGTIPELAARRADYLEATRGPLRPSLPDYDARLIEPIHLMEYVAQAGIDGVARTRARLAALSDVFGRLVDAGLDEDRALIVLAVAADRNARLAEIEHLLDEPATVTSTVGELVDAGWLVWDRAGNLQPSGPNPFRPG